MKLQEFLQSVNAVKDKGAYVFLYKGVSCAGFYRFGYMQIRPLNASWDIGHGAGQAVYIEIEPEIINNSIY